MGLLLLFLVLLVLFFVFTFFHIQVGRAALLVTLVLLAWYPLAHSPPPLLVYIPLLLLSIKSAVVFNCAPLRRKLMTGPLFHKAKNIMPKVSDTEQEALAAGTTWWDAEIWTGKPDWQSVLAYPVTELSSEEKEFLAGPVEELCTMLDDWQITHEQLDLPPEVWAYLKEKRFFGIIIPTQYGGLGFSAAGHSAIVMKIAGRSITAAVTVMVPNSIGPAELLYHYGTRAQKDYYLPRLARGEEIPCFGLTGPEAGSDASATPDYGTVCRAIYDGQETLGIRLNWHKRYITLGPVATLIGLAFKLYDPDRLLGDTEDLGITFALVPRNTEGISVGNRHFPLNCPFFNGPNQGKDVFIPMKMVIGELEGVGKGWHMLMEALAAGRGISLPALSTGGAKLAARSMGAYAVARKQFNVSLSKFEGVEEALTRIGGYTYIMDSARAITLAGLDHGERPAVITGIIKYHLTEMMRATINDAMDIHGGAGICLGPRNLLGRIYQSIPIGITVEGANILTRSFIIFNQSLLRCHPFIGQEIEAIEKDDLKHFDKALMGHMGFLLTNLSRSLILGLGGVFLLPGHGHPSTRSFMRQITRMSAAFALVGDVAMMVLGASLKRKEKLTGRLSDVVSNLFLAMAVIKHFHDQGAHKEDIPLMEWSCQKTLYAVQESLISLLSNFPHRPLGWALRALVFPLGRSFTPPNDRLGKEVADILTTASPARDRLTEGLFLPHDPDEMLAALEAFLHQPPVAEATEKAFAQLWKKNTPRTLSLAQCIAKAEQDNLFSALEGAALLKRESLRQQIIAVDDFADLGQEDCS